MSEREVHEAIESASSHPADPHPSRRQFAKGLAGAAALTALVPSSAFAGDPSAATPPSGPASKKSLAATPPAGFVPFSAPGKVVEVKKAGSLQDNKLYPKEADAKEMLTRVLTELTGTKDLQSAVMKFVHKDDIVCVKVNGIARQNMATAKELVMPFLEAMIAGGVKAENITVLEQYIGFFTATRLNQQNLPPGVKMSIHQNKDATMPDRMIPGTGTRTKFVRAFTEATAVINFALVKDHSIQGYTGALKNMTHGCSINPHDFHARDGRPQIAQMYAQDVIKSRVRLCISDAFKVMADGGPLWKQPQFVKPYEAVLASTDPVALDTIGWGIVEEHRKQFGIKTLAEAGREPVYIKAAEGLGLGIHERTKIQLKNVVIA